jgi:hypothetical protein
MEKEPIILAMLDPSVLASAREGLLVASEEMTTTSCKKGVSMAVSMRGVLFVGKYLVENAAEPSPCLPHDIESLIMAM